MEKMFDISFVRCSDGEICLTQSENGEDSVIVLAPEQVKYIARRLCGFKEGDAQRVEELERRLAVLADKIQNLACSSWVRNELLERDTEGDLILTRLDALADLALEFDGGRLKPESPDDEKPICPPNGVAPVKAPTHSGAVKNAAKADSARSGGIPAGQSGNGSEAINHCRSDAEARPTSSGVL